MKHKFRIAVDFDGTLCEECWPKIGLPNKALIKWLIEKRKEGCYIILWTLRENCIDLNDDFIPLLYDAIDWCKDRGLEFDKVNEFIHYQAYGYTPRKFPAEMYIDDRSFNPTLNIEYNPHGSLELQLELFYLRAKKRFKNSMEKMGLDYE